MFSGGVCHLEQLHAKSPFLFPIAFGINAFMHRSHETLVKNNVYIFTFCCSRKKVVEPMGKTSLVLDMVDVQEYDSGLRWNKFLL